MMKITAFGYIIFTTGTKQRWVQHWFVLRENQWYTREFSEGASIFDVLAEVYGHGWQLTAAMNNVYYLHTDKWVY